MRKWNWCWIRVMSEIEGKKECDCESDQWAALWTALMNHLAISSKSGIMHRQIHKWLLIERRFTIVNNSNIKFGSSGYIRKHLCALKACLRKPLQEVCWVILLKTCTFGIHCLPQVLVNVAPSAAEDMYIWRRWKHAQMKLYTYLVLVD